MNIKLLLGGLVLVAVVGFIASSVLTEDRDLPTVEQNPDFQVSRPAAKPVPNTFTVMTPEEKAAAEAEAARLAAEATLISSSTASTSATTSAPINDEDAN